MSHAPGSVFSEEAYALGKMLDHSSWQDDVKMARGITPSDIDMAIDNNGQIMFCELSSQHRTWSAISEGQRRLYENCIKGALHCAVLCHHNVRPEEKRMINTRTDIAAFQVMVWDHAVIYSNVVASNEHWQKFVLDWTNEGSGPLKFRRQVIGNSVREFKAA